MWIKKDEYQRLNRELVNETQRNGRLIQLINDWEKQYNDAKQEVERIKEKAFTRGQILAEKSYRDLVLMANNQYGIMPNRYEDKADLIEEILHVEKQLKAVGQK